LVIDGNSFSGFSSGLGGKMPSVQSLQTEQFNDWVSMEPEYWIPKGPIIEALRLLALLETGDTVDDVRRLIAVPHDIEASLRAYIFAHPEQSFEIESSLSFRQEVAEAFERLVSMYIVDKSESICHGAVTQSATMYWQRDGSALT
jgi:hypothetical protein